MHTPLCLAVLATVAMAQDRPRPDFASDLAALDAARPTDPARIFERDTEIGAARAFLDRYGSSHARHLKLLQVRLRLGSDLLHAQHPKEALEQFQAVLARAPEDDRDLRGRASYGKAQAEELAGDRTAAKATLRALVDTHAGDRYARYATIALARIEHAERPDAEVGFDPGPLIDLDGRVHRIRDDLTRPAVIVFWSPDVPSAVERLRRVARAWKAAGQDADRCFAAALGADPTRLRQAVRDLDLRCPVIPCDDEFLDPSVLAARVTKIPTTLLVAPDGAVLARDLAPADLERIAARLK